MAVRTKSQREPLCGALETSRLLYNAGLEERSGAWRKAKLRIGLHNQYKSLTVLSGDPSLRGLPVHLLRWPLKRLTIDRDHNSAMNILAGRRGAGGRGVAARAKKCR